VRSYARRFHRCFWPGTAITLSAWEAAALLTGRPTITDVSRMVRRHKAGKVVIVMWTAGLCYHLLVSKGSPPPPG